MAKSKDYQLRAEEAYRERRYEKGDSIFSFNFWIEKELRESAQSFADKHHDGILGAAIRELVARGLQDEELVSSSLIKASYKEKLGRLQDENKALLNQNNRLKSFSHSLLRQMLKSRKKRFKFLFRCEKSISEAISNQDASYLLSLAVEDDNLTYRDKKEGDLTEKGYLSTSPAIVESIYHIALDQFDCNIHTALRALLRKGMRLAKNGD